MIIPAPNISRNATQRYIQMITAGYIIVLQAEGTRYTYHADKKGNVATCADS